MKAQNVPKVPELEGYDWCARQVKTGQFRLRGKNFGGTWNNYHLHTGWEAKIEAIMGACVKFACQEEVGESGTRHLQMALSFKRKQNCISTRWLPSTFHWFVMRAGTKDRGNELAAYWYCLDPAKRMDGGRKWRLGVPDCPRPIERITYEMLHPWQKSIYDSCRDPCGPFDRKIRWIWEPNGNVGKSVLAKAFHDMDEFPSIFVSGKNKDVLFALATFVEKHGQGPQVIIIDVPRVNHGAVSYQAIENAKNGLFFSAKFESVTVRANIPHVIIFSNQEPDYASVSGDRWWVQKIVSVNGERQLKDTWRRVPLFVSL